MANWCENRLLITGQGQGLDIFAEYAESKSGDNELLSANAFVPYPEKFEELDRISDDYKEKHPDDYAGCPADGYNQDGYEWCCENWGTKCDFCVVNRTRIETVLEYVFDTAWSPPRPAILAMGKMFPALNFRLDYCEPGNGFQGVFIVSGGKIVKDETSDYFPSCDDEDEVPMGAEVT